MSASWLCDNCRKQYSLLHSLLHVVKNGQSLCDTCFLYSGLSMKIVKLNVSDSEPSGLTLPTDSTERKNYPLLRGCLKYFPAALAGVARISKIGNDKHNPGQDLHHDRNKSMDHSDCIIRHLMDLEDLLAASKRAQSPLTPFGQQQILDEVSSIAWRALAYSQELHEQFGAPLAPGAKK